MAKRILTGQIVSDKMQNTVVVEVVRKFRHPLYNKIIKVSKKYKADTNNVGAVYGDTVKIEETRPLSKSKYFKVISKLSEKEAKAAPVVSTTTAKAAVKKPRVRKVLVKKKGEKSS